AARVLRHGRAPARSAPRHSAPATARARSRAWRSAPRSRGLRIAATRARIRRARLRVVEREQEARRLEVGDPLLALGLPSQARERGVEGLVHDRARGRVDRLARGIVEPEARQRLLHLARADRLYARAQLADRRHGAQRGEPAVEALLFRLHDRFRARLLAPALLGVLV